MRSGEDLGLDRSGQTGRQRLINDDGSYNMQRKTGRLLGNFYLYHWLLTTSWTRFWIGVFSFYALMNLLFAAVYYYLGFNSLNGMNGTIGITRFIYCFFFSAQTFTTVGYGTLSPLDKMSNVVATLESFIGLMTFALATGTLYGRFSKPVSRIKYSKNILIAPYKDITGLQFMIANELSSALMEMEAKVNLSWAEEDETGKRVRQFQQVKLEIDKINMFPTSWTINHPIDEESALYGKTLDQIRQMDFEIFILIRGFDDVFSQTIYSRHSFVAREFVWGAKFKRPFHLDENGKMVMDLRTVGDYDPVTLLVPSMAE